MAEKEGKEDVGEGIRFWVCELRGWERDRTDLREFEDWGGVMGRGPFASRGLHHGILGPLEHRDFQHTGAPVFLRGVSC